MSRYGLNGFAEELIAVPLRQIRVMLVVLTYVLNESLAVVLVRIVWNCGLVVEPTGRAINLGY